MYEEFSNWSQYLSQWRMAPTENKKKKKISHALSIGNSPEDKVVGILGMGGIGRAIRDRLKPFGLGK